MGSNLRTLYLYIVSFITLSMIVGGIMAAIGNISAYFLPDDSAFFEDNTSSSSYSYSDYDEDEVNEIERLNYKNEKIKGAIVSVVVIAVGGIMYKYHWNMIEKERKNEN